MDIMKRCAVCILLLAVATAWFFTTCGNDGSSVPSPAVTVSPLLDTINSDTLVVKATGATSATCTITGAQGRALGSGAPDNIEYTVGIERAVVVHCGNLAAIIPVGADEVALTTASTSVANSLNNTMMGSGIVMLASAIEKVLDAPDNSGNAKSLYKVTETNNSIVADALIEIALALDVIANPNDLTTLKNAIIKILVNSGEAVVIESVGSGGTLSACTDAAAQTFSSQAKTANASVIGMTGCLVYHGLDAITDQNNPLGAPANNVPESFRSVAKETGIIQELVNSFVDNRYFATSNIHSYLFTTLGHTAYLENDEGVISSTTISSGDMGTTLASLFAAIQTTTDLDSYRFHTGYNPSGGWEINAAATLQTLPEACVDSDRSTACSVDPLHFDFDGTTLTANPSGSYILEMIYQGGAFTTKGYILNATTGKPYRNALYQPVQVTINPSDYSAIDYANPLYVAALDPMNDGAGNSAPFSNANWRAKYPAMSLVNNAYLFPTPEIVGRQWGVVGQTPNLSRLSALQAYTIGKMIERGMAAFPVGSTYPMLNDHNNTVSQWQSLTTTWLQSGTPAPKINGSGSMRLRNGQLTVSSASCTNSMGSAVACTVTCTIRISQSPITVPEGTKFNVTSGSYSVSSTPIGTITYTPTYLLVATSNTSAQLLGDLNLSYSFTGQSLRSKVISGTAINATYSMTAIGN